MSHSHSRPWYVLDGPCDEYKEVISENGGPQMIKVLKLLRALIVNAGLIGVTVYGLSLGANPTPITILALLTLGAYNGIEYADYLALAEAYAEHKQE